MMSRQGSNLQSVADRLSQRRGQGSRDEHRCRTLLTRGRNRRGQAILEYAILVAALLLGTIVGVVVLNQRIADLVGYSIEVSTFDPVTGENPNRSVGHETLLPTSADATGQTVIDGPTSLDEASGIDDIGELIRTEGL